MWTDVLNDEKESSIGVGGWWVTLSGKEFQAIGGELTHPTKLRFWVLEYTPETLMQEGSPVY